MNVLETQLLSVATAYCAGASVELGVASFRAAGDGRILPLLKAGSHSLTIRRGDRALQWFSDNWPAGAEWPADVPRPSPSDAAPEAAHAEAEASA